MGLRLELQLLLQQGRMQQALLRTVSFPSREAGLRVSFPLSISGYSLVCGKEQLLINHIMTLPIITV